MIELNVKEPGLDHYKATKEDVDRIIFVCHKYGYVIGSIEAYIAWQSHSRKNYNEEWRYLPTNETALVEAIRMQCSETKY
jgi:hypothetical protein